MLQAILIFQLFFTCLTDSVDRLLERLPKLESPVHFNSNLKVNSIPISRSEVWQYLIQPIERNTTSSFSDFIVDSATIVEYKQWENADYNEFTPKINFYSPTFSGDIFAIGKFEFGNGLTGILWGFDQEDIMHGTGRKVWLVLYSSNLKAIDYKTIYEKTAGGSPLESFQIQTTSTFDKNIVDLKTVSKTGKKPKNSKRIRYSITELGFKKE